MCSHPARRPADARGMSTPIAVPVRLGVERSPSGRDQSFRLRSHIVSSQHDQLISVIEMKASPGRTAPRFTLAVPHSVIDALRDQQRDRCPPTRPLAPRVSSAGIVVCGLFRRDLADDGSGGPDMDGVRRPGTLRFALPPSGGETEHAPPTRRSYRREGARVAKPLYARDGRRYRPNGRMSTRSHYSPVTHGDPGALSPMRPGCSG